MRSDIYDLTGFQRDLLYVAAGLDEPHGLAVKNELEKCDDEDERRARGVTYRPLTTVHDTTTHHHRPSCIVERVIELSPRDCFTLFFSDQLIDRACWHCLV